MTEVLRKIEKMELCRLIRDGVEANLFMGQKLLEEELSGVQKDMKKLGQMLLTQIALPTIKKFCTPYIPNESYDNYNRAFEKLIKDMELLEG